MSLGDDIKRARLGCGYSLRGLAKMCDISPTYLSRLETNKEAKPSEEVCDRLAAILGLDSNIMIIRAKHVPKWMQELIYAYPQKVIDIFKGI